MTDPRLKKLANLLVHYSTSVKKDDFVLVQAGDIAIPWINEVVREAIKTGAHVETLVDIPDVSEIILKNSSDEQLIKERYIQKIALEKADVWLTAWANKNTKANTNVDPKKLQLSAKGATSWRKIYSERMGNGTLRWCGTQYPTQADAQEAEMSLSEYEDFVYGAGFMDSVDPIAQWQKIHDEQENWVNYLNKKSEIRILSEGTDIKVNVAGRKWINCCGKENFPDGEVFTSPVENNINGHITFSFPGIYMGKSIEGIYLEVENGLVVKATAKKGEDLLHALMNTDNGAKYFGEVAIGTNYGIQKFTRNMLFDEKIGGTVHMAVGDSMPEAGGKNRSTIHWDMLCDMRRGGEIYADGELFYKDGHFIKSVL
ncbi:aminopeptidase [Thermoanaerobacterium sp. RBIITD]|uniref:aminopeptidase n=1 Tax=Thermoanaerobacterium sp. RBIITD TaxID=1550240 RepID=UPI000BB8A38E|nr:aminopeptidase [Thermoanaerobacterium sp. RBIITD]SNX54887.1 Leucyl aminopeptidase (aminopeptidase T) [Thermoanaerobacterium sp. RBIITD]